MTQTVPATAQLGPGKTGLAIGYRVLDIDRVEYSAFTTTNVAETGTAGTYSVAGGVVAPNAGGYIVWGVSGTDYVEATVDSDVINSVSGSIGGKVLGGGSDTITGIGAQVASSGLTAQQTADAVNNLAPASTGATGSIRAQLDAIKLITDAIDTSAVTVTASNDAGVLTLIQAVTFNATVSGLTISATWAKLYFTLKYSEYDDDPDAIVQIVETNPAAALTDGLLYIDGAAIVAPITIADGTLTVSQAAGTVVIAITDNATALLAKASDLVWDIKTKDASGATVQNTTGTASIGRAITQTI